jgi:hypothetical protein
MDVSLRDGSKTRSTGSCWIRAKHLADISNRLPRPGLTHTDVVQRLRAFWEEPWATYPNEELLAGCRPLYKIEKF